MGIISSILRLILGPLELLFDIVFSFMNRLTYNPGYSIIALSLAINFLVLPLYMRADAMQEEERQRTQKFSPFVTHIKKTFKGDERFMILQTYYRQNNYKPYYALKGSLSLLLEIPFFIAAYNFLSELQMLHGAPLGPIADLGKPDGLLHFAGHSINILPILMTLVNIVSGIIYTKGMPLKSKIQLYGMAMIFLVLLYSSPSGLVFYWLLNNLFSLIKNIFYKLRNPALVLCSICSSVGIYAFFWLMKNPPWLVRMRIFAYTASLLLASTLGVYLFFKKYPVSFKSKEATKDDRIIFIVCTILLSVITGLLIPSSIIDLSPAEFVNELDFYTPLRYVFNAFLLAAGTFLVWMNVFYYLTSPSGKRIFSICMLMYSAISLVDYMFFGKEYGNMSPMLQYDNYPYSSATKYLINASVLIALVLVLLFIRNKYPAVIRLISIAVCSAAVIISCMNIFDIQSYFNEIKKNSESFSQSQGYYFTLDKKGKNVVVIMLDKAVSDFFPYIVNEKPELQEQFAGFTYYPNTLSYGSCTVVGTPGLFGGYEYTPAESNKRAESVKQKQNEALCIMPDLFADNGYNVTVFDPPYAGFSDYSDLSIYSDHPSINAVLLKNKLAGSYQPEVYNQLLYRNLYVYSIFRTSPVFLHATVYNSGIYNHSTEKYSVQVIHNMFSASGGFDGCDRMFTGTYTVLQNMNNLTSITDNGDNNFFMMDNDTTHDVVMLQEPDYEPSNQINNRPYEEDIPVRYAADGSKMEFTTVNQFIHYQCYMAAMLKLGNWMDYLRENGVYDNTRIIIVSDHGRNLDYLGNLRINDTEDDENNINDIMRYKPTLLVKDFNSTELTVDDTFMTNADTPVLAFSGLIENPVNPFTGKKISSDTKNSDEHIIAMTPLFFVNKYRGDEEEYKEVTWLGLKGNNVNDTSAWRIIGDKLP